MAYTLNTSDTTQKITLGSEGTYTGDVYKSTFFLSSVVDSDPATIPIVGVDTVCMDHPTVFHKNYMYGTIQETTFDTTYDVSQYDFETDLHKIYYKPDPNTDLTTYATVDLILYDLLLFLKEKTGDDTFYYDFTDDSSDDYPYNAGTSGSMTLVSPGSYTSAHTYILRHLIFRRRCQLVLSCTSAYTYSMTGRFVRMFGLNPADEHVVSSSSQLSIEIPYDGFTYINLNTSLTRDHIVFKKDDQAQSSSLTCIIPAPGIPGDPIYFNNTSSAGRMGMAQNRLDYIEIAFTDEKNVPLYSLDNYVITFAVDWMIPTPFPAEDRFTLDQARVNKKIRIK